MGSASEIAANAASTKAIRHAVPEEGKHQPVAQGGSNSPGGSAKKREIQSHKGQIQ